MKSACLLGTWLLVGCGASDSEHAAGAGGSGSVSSDGGGATGGGGSASGGASGSGGTASTGGPSGSGGASSGSGGRGSGGTTTPFERPPYTPQPGTCGFDKPAFCDNFEDGPRGTSGRSGELDVALWSGVRGGPWDHPNLTQSFPAGPAIIPKCRVDLPDRVLSDRDALVCDPVDTVPSRHLMIATAMQNYGLTSYRIRQPFDFEGRTGILKFDVDLSNNGLGGWPAIVISGDPSSAPSFDWEERGSGPRNGVSIEFSGGWCNNKNTLEVGLFTFRDYVQTAMRPSFDCETPHVTTGRHSLNHVEIYLTNGHLEVWASDVSPDGVNFPNFHLVRSDDVALPFERASVNLIVRNHATSKYWVGSAWATRWDNVGFDGPVVKDTREYSASDGIKPMNELEGCRIDGTCRFRGDVIAENPDDGSMCGPDATCKFEGEGSLVGYVVPRDDEAPVAIHVEGVSMAGAKSAHLVFGATYPWFDWNGVSKPPTAIILQYRVNGGPFHDRPLSDVEANAFTDFSPDLGGAGHGAGLLNQRVELDVAELKDGDNVVELRTKGTWTGDYRAGVTGVDLVLDTPR